MEPEMPDWLNEFWERVAAAIKWHDSLSDPERSWLHCKSGHPETEPDKADRWQDLLNELGEKQGVVEARKLFGNWKRKFLASASDVDKYEAILDAMRVVSKEDRKILWAMAYDRPVWKIAQAKHWLPERVTERQQFSLHQLLTYVMA